MDQRDLDPEDPISILAFLCAYMKACDDIAVDDRPTARCVRPSFRIWRNML